MAGSRRARVVLLAATVSFAVVWWAGPVSARPPASVQYELGGSPSGEGQPGGVKPAPPTDPGDVRPASVAFGSLDNEEVILLLALILIITGVAIALAISRSRLPRSRRAFAIGGLAALTASLALVAVLPAGGAQRRPPSVPKLYYGIIPQLERPAADYKRMKSIGVDSVRFPIPWDAVERSPGNYDFSLIDRYVERAARAGLEIFPAVNATPSFYGTNCTNDCFRTLPQTPQQLTAWSKFLKAVVNRYGSHGSFWSQNRGVPKHAIGTLQIWNEENFVFFTEPRSPSAYGKLVKVSHQAVHSADPTVKIILGGLFAHPKSSQGIQAATFLNQLYKVGGIKSSFDGVALHPYAKDASELPRDIGQIRTVMKRHGDAKTGFYITEMGWGSAHDTAFEKGLQGQSRELAQAFTLLRKMQSSAHLQRVFWYSWEDIANSCNFCDSTGLIRINGSAKPAYSTYRAFALNKR
jgi:hypothetical protein